MTRLPTAAEDDEPSSVWDQLDETGRKALLMALLCVFIVGAFVALRVRANSDLNSRRRDSHVRAIANEAILDWERQKAARRVMG